VSDPHAPATGVPAPSEPSASERVKATSAHLRGSIAAELATPTPVFGDASVQLIKFHGIYQQDDRDQRRALRAAGGEKAYQMMIRVRVPGGRVSPAAYLAHDRIVRRWGNGTLRITTRQAFQLHGVVKGDLRRTVRSINRTLLTTLAGCGDVERNITCCPAPRADRLRTEVAAVLADLVAALTPATSAYHEIWIDGQRARVTPAAPELEELYGDTYLPRKFKTAIALPGDNCVDVYAHDLGLVARRGDDGGLAGFTVLVGGGLGRTHHKLQTYPHLGQPLAEVPPAQAVALARAVVGVQRDHGDRRDRRHARLKYLVAERGLGWLRAEVEARLGHRLAEPGPLRWPAPSDHLGWHAQGDGLLYCGIHVENGRIRDRPEAALMTGLRRLVAELGTPVRLTPQQNLILTHIPPRQRVQVDAILAAHGVLPVRALPPTVRHAMACPALPTCGLAVAEAERVLPSLLRRLVEVADGLGLGREAIGVRMTGCPNGCTRPYLGDVGLVGTTLGKYDLHLGGDAAGTRLNSVYLPSVPLAEIPDRLQRPLRLFARERLPGERFGDFCHRIGVTQLRHRCGEVGPEAVVPIGA